MKELLDLQSECLKRFNIITTCGACPINLHCKQNGCKEADCSKCLNAIQYGIPPFHYSCEKITYHYVLRFFNRFASEIAYAAYLLPIKDVSEYNVVSLGCGPGSEVYGLIKVLRDKFPKTQLNYQGFDLNQIWADVQNLSLNFLSPSGYNVSFYNADMFMTFSGFQTGSVDLLILNYLLSDMEKFSSTIEQKRDFISDLTAFIVKNGVKWVLFNDTSYFGYKGKWDSGCQLMLELINNLKAWHMEAKAAFICFPSDKYPYGAPWKQYKSEKLLFKAISNNTLNQGINSCGSKQIIVKV